MLTPVQQAKFRVLEMEVEQRMRELMNRVRPAAGAAAKDARPDSASGEAAALGTSDRARYTGRTYGKQQEEGGRARPAARKRAARSRGDEGEPRRAAPKKAAAAAPRAKSAARSRARSKAHGEEDGPRRRRRRPGARAAAKSAASAEAPRRGAGRAPRRDAPVAPAARRARPSEEDQIRAAKYLPRELPKRLFEEDRFLFPETYGVNRVRLLVSDPEWIFALLGREPGGA